ncbi:MAG: ThiF family adenylyltransferase [Armatimonadetes bacterium]|nr:ThiF family adenylyltransferase [Armatimonadota bacterium]
MRFFLTHEILSPQLLDSPAAGGFATFEGKVRNHADGQAVEALEYEVFAEMALVQGEAILNEAISKFELEDARATHRVGRVCIGESAVIVQTAAAHRREAFEACEWIMDQIKWRVPIWKKENYAGRPSEWVSGGESSRPAEFEELYDRHIRLPEIGKEGQLKLQNARVLLVGVGGLAAGSLPALVGSGIGTIGLVDPDTVEGSNLHRQTLFAQSDIGRLKVERASALAKRLRHSIQCHPFPEVLTETNAFQIVENFDWVVDGTDSLDTKFLLNRVCRSLRKNLVTASVHRFEGQILTITPDGPCLECMFPDPPPNHCVGTCADLGVLGVVPYFLGSCQAVEVIQGILGSATLTESLALVDLRSLQIDRIQRTRSRLCRLCNQIDEAQPEQWEVSSPDEMPHAALVDIRDLSETPCLALPHKRIPMSGCYDRKWDQPTIFICASGVRSYRLVADLRSSGFSEVYSLRGGMQSLISRHG